MESDKYSEGVKRKIEKLNKMPELLTLVGSVPIIGSALSQAITGIGQQIIQERNERLFEMLGNRVDSLQKETIKRDFYESQEGFDLLLQALDESRRTRSDEKRDLIARVLAAATTSIPKGGYSLEDYLNIISSLTEKELAVARTIYDFQRNRYVLEDLDEHGRIMSWKECKEEIASKHSIQEADLPLFLNRIETSGLIANHPVLAAGGGGIPTYWVTPIFNNLIRLLSETD